MFRIENLKKMFRLLDEAEKENKGFTQEEKLLLYRMAFYKESFEEVQTAVLQAAEIKPGGSGRAELFGAYAESLPQIPDGDAAQLEQYIFRLQKMCHEQEKAMEILEHILELNGVSKGHNPIAVETEASRKGKSGREENGKAR